MTCGRIICLLGLYPNRKQPVNFLASLEDSYSLKSTDYQKRLNEQEMLISNNWAINGIFMDICCNTHEDSYVPFYEKSNLYRNVLGGNYISPIITVCCPVLRLAVIEIN